MAQWYKVYWQSSTGQRKTSLTRSPNRLQSEVMGRGGSVYKVVQPYASRRKYPKANIGEDREKVIISREPIPTKTKGPIARREGLGVRKTDQPDNAAWEYLKSHTRGKAKHRLIQAERVPGAKGKYAASMVAMRLAYGRLTPEQKREFGYRYTEWGEIPAVERKQYYGGKKHLESLSSSEREQLIERFKKEEPTSALVHGELSKILHAESSEDQRIWKGLTLSEGEQQKDFWKSIPDPMRWGISGVHAFASASLWGITLPQSLVKLFTGGKTLILPDVSKELSKYKPMAAPSGLLSTAISEGIGAYTGKGSDAWAKFQKDIGSGISATIGEIAGLKIGSVPVSGGLKTFRIAKIGLKYGKKDMLSYMRGAKVLARQYPVMKGFPKIYRSGDKYASIWKYKGLGKKVLVSSKEVPKLGKTGSGYFRFTPLGKRLEFRVIYENLKVKGIFRKTITKTYASTGKSHWILEKGVSSKPVHLFTARDSGMVVKGFLKSNDAYATLTRQIHARPMISGRMHHAGYLTAETIKLPAGLSHSLSMSAIGYGMSQVTLGALNTEMKQANLGLSVSRSALKRASAFENISIQSGAQNLDFAQVQKQLQSYKTKTLSKLSTAYSFPSTHGGRGKATTSAPFSLTLPKIAIWLPGDRTRRKKKSFFDIPPPDFAYHERIHPSRDIEKMLDVKGLTTGNMKGLSKEMEKISKSFKVKL